MFPYSLERDRERHYLGIKRDEAIAEASRTNQSRKTNQVVALTQ